MQIKIEVTVTEERLVLTTETKAKIILPGGGTGYIPVSVIQAVKEKEIIPDVIVEEEKPKKGKK